MKWNFIFSCIFLNLFSAFLTKTLGLKGEFFLIPMNMILLEMSWYGKLGNIVIF